MMPKITNFQKAFKEKTVTTLTGIQMHTESFGTQKNPAFLLISGAMACARFWIDEFCQQLTNAGFFVIRYDHRDIGLSSPIDYKKNPYTQDDLAKDAIAILDAYAIKKAHIVGHSMGGALAQLIAINHPERVLSITLISSSTLTTVALTAQEQEALTKTWQDLASYNKPTKNFAESVDGFMHSYAYLHGDLPVDRGLTYAYIKDLYYRSRPEHIAWFEQYSAGIEPMHNHVKAQQNNLDHSSQLKQITCPVLVIHGQKDRLCFVRVMRDYCKQFIPQAHTHIIPDMGHMILSRALFTRIKDLIIEQIT